MSIYNCFADHSVDGSLTMFRDKKAIRRLATLSDCKHHTEAEDKQFAETNLSCFDGRRAEAKDWHGRFRNQVGGRA